MFKLALGMVIGSLVTYNVILPDDSYRATFVGFNDWSMAKISALLEDVKDDTSASTTMHYTEYLDTVVRPMVEEMGVAPK